MPGCGVLLTEYVERGFHVKEIKVKCGDTSPTGYPWQCEKCAEINKDRDWRREAMENGENFDDEY